MVASVGAGVQAGRFSFKLFPLLGIILMLPIIILYHTYSRLSIRKMLVNTKKQLFWVIFRIYRIKKTLIISVLPLILHLTEIYDCYILRIMILSFV